MRSVLGLLARMPARVAASTLLAAAMVLAGIGLMASSGALIARASLRPDSVLELLVLITGVRFFGLTRAAVRYVERYVAHDLTLRLLARLRGWVYRRLQPLAPLELGGRRSGDLLSRLVADVDEVQTVYLRLVAPLLAAVVVTAVSATLTCFVSGAAALTLVASLGVAGGLVPGALAGLSRRLGARENAARVRQRVLLLDALQGSVELWVYGRNEDALARLRAADAWSARLARRRALIVGARDGAGTLAALAGPLLVLAAALPAATSPGAALLLVPLTLGAMAAFEAVQPLAEAFERWSAARAAATRIEDIVLKRPTVRDPVVPRAVPGGGDLRLERVSFAYGAREVVAGIDLRLAPGRRVALVGASGAGKSTVLALLVRFADAATGRVTLDGVDVRSLAQAELRARLAVVPQHVKVFRATVRANLSLARPGATDDDLWRALVQAELSELVRTLPEGLDTFLDGDGARLSGGERQRLAIARALLKDAPWLLLDEPTAHVDAATERLLRGRLLAPDDRRGVLWITHRLEGLEAVDEIVVLEGGRVAERGTHAELARAEGVYVRLMNAQADGVQDTGTPRPAGPRREPATQREVKNPGGTVPAGTKKARTAVRV